MNQTANELNIFHTLPATVKLDPSLKLLFTDSFGLIKVLGSRCSDSLSSCQPTGRSKPEQDTVSTDASLPPLGPAEKALTHPVFSVSMFNVYFNQH